MTKWLLDSALQGEMTDHVGYALRTPAEEERPELTQWQAVQDPNGLMIVQMSRDRNGAFEPLITQKHSAN
ncbi:hypothetical protein [Streptomyces sp. 1222.5]|uniref:hypothetical protein n=1 Tax=Streptomyces sp. 1222.5 TaxID=1881026 RepID=UPI003EC0FD2E